ncbi:hypothetical protein [Abyssisolibacter fermentans]|uniref:hypothetical protein n=1 Tax=Abyssisolibacter fermentans TaxID=1766203 RepID=UPI00082EAC41|nr:hypothetical protein [Abyssisolibacter fermentans]
MHIFYSITLKQLFYYIAIPATLVLVIQTIFTLIGFSAETDMDIEGDLDVDSDIDVDMDNELTGFTHGIRFFSIRGLIAFFTLFGWVGISLCNTNLSKPIIIFIACFSGVIGMVCIALLFYWITKLQSNGLLDLRNTLGKTCEVYLTIPSKRKGVGKVSILVQDRYIELDAITDESQKLSTGTIVRVIDISNNSILVVEKDII